jgi:hypothetical protein
LIDAPSGIGKTQLPFTFQATGVPIRHLLMTVDLPQLQTIYAPLTSISTIFTNALRSDVAQLNGALDGLETNQLLANFSFEFQTVGVIFALLKVEYDKCPSWKVSNLADYVRATQDKQLLPIFVLDEVLPHYDHGNGSRQGSSELRLARNLLRAVGLVAVLMGTNSCAANFISVASGSRGGANGPWCKLITRLPPSTDESLRELGAQSVIDTLRGYHNLASICPFLVQQFRSCTPWFIELFVEAVAEIKVENLLFNARTSAVDFLDNVLCRMAKKVYSRKGAHRSQSFLRAQFCYHLEPLRKPRSIGQSLPDCSPEEKKVSGADTSAFVASHFASLNDDDCDLFIFGDYLSKDQETQWVPTASFRRATDDSFLYLMLGDGNQRNLSFSAPFVLSSLGRRKMTTLETFLNLISDHEKKSSGTRIPTENPLAVKRNGADLEVTAAVAVEIASHRGGLGGILIADFLLQLAIELLPSPEPLQWSVDSPFSSVTCLAQMRGQQVMKPDTTVDLTSVLAGKTVPYLSSAGDSWPEEFRSIDGVHWGHFSRTKDNERIDLAIRTAESPTDPEISGECKNYKNNLDGVVLREILQRIPQTSWLHLVICTHLQATYWTEATKFKWSDFQTQYDLRASAILRVVKQGSRLSLESLFPGSVPEEGSSRLVVFFPFEDWNSPDELS